MLVTHPNARVGAGPRRGVRWSIEECFQDSKGHVGLDHYQVRHWTSWHRHITLAMLALAFLAALAADAAPERPPTRISLPVVAIGSRDRPGAVVEAFVADLTVLGVAGGIAAAAGRPAGGDRR
ncbi:hypothetical protein QRN89_29385 [Streptomyces chengbuensis]|nr:hypothetical protein [Streptomyces sp. HUAS CB01]WJY53559.1 hypothetical protein QRN89_29385 [Streptomyces sp. HUAS CB01]